MIDMYELDSVSHRMIFRRSRIRMSDLLVIILTPLKYSVVEELPVSQCLGEVECQVLRAGCALKVTCSLLVHCKLSTHDPLSKVECSPHGRRFGVNWCEWTWNPA